MKTVIPRQSLNRTRYSIQAALLLSAACLPSCSEKPQPPPAPAPKGRVAIKGSNTIGEELAPRLIEAYKKDHASVVFELESKATGYGIASLLAGQCEIAGASRPLIAEELELAKGRNIQLDDHIIGSYAVAVIVNPANPIGSMTKDQVRDLFTGAARNWKDVGGSDSAVHLYIRDPVSGTFLGFRELAMENKAYGSGPTALTNYSQIAEAVSRDPVGIGYIGFDQLAASGVKAVSIQNIAPEAAAVNQNKYPFARVLHLYTNKAGTSAEAADFIKFVQSSAGKQILAQAGFVPAP